MNPVHETVAALRDVFRRNPDKYEAHRKCVPILEQASRQPEFMTDMLRRYLEKPQSLNRGNYPAVGIEIDLNPWFGISANCWIPLLSRPARELHWSGLPSVSPDSEWSRGSRAALQHSWIRGSHA